MRKDIAESIRSAYLRGYFRDRDKTILRHPLTEPLALNLKQAVNKNIGVPTVLAKDDDGYTTYFSVMVYPFAIPDLEEAYDSDPEVIIKRVKESGGSLDYISVWISYLGPYSVLTWRRLKVLKHGAIEDAIIKP